MKKNEQDTAETLKLEKIIQKLETFDIHEWIIYKHSMSIKANGIEFCLRENTYGINKYYFLSIKNIEDNAELIEYNSYCKNKILVKMVGDFYEKTRTLLMDYKSKVLEERLDTFLTE